MFWKTWEGERNHAHLDLSTNVEFVTHPLVSNRQLALKFLLVRDVDENTHEPTDITVAQLESGLPTEQIMIFAIGILIG